MINHCIRLTGTGILILALLTMSAAPVQARDGQPQDQGYVVTITQVDTSNFPTINVWVSVTDTQGRPTTTVPDSAFSLVENGQPVAVTEVYQAGEQGAVTAVLTIDRSGSMNTSGKLDAAKSAANTFIDLMRPEDKTGVIVFNTQVEVLQPLTSDKQALHTAINGISAFEDTAMYDALQESMGMLSGVQGRKVIVILSDGLDNSSQQTAASILGGLEQAETSVYTVGLGDPASGTGSMAGIDENALRSIAEKSRGAYSYAPDSSSLQTLYEQISFRVQNEYRLTYISPSTLRDGIRRGLEVHVAEAGAVQANYNPGGLIPETAQALGWPVFGGLLVALIGLLALPDIFRRFGGTMQGKSLFKKKSRVRLTGSGNNKQAVGKPAIGKQPVAPPHVKMQGKGG